MPEGGDRSGRDDCFICGNGHAEILETHHIVPRRFGGSDGDLNVVDLCPTCHAALENLYDERFYDALSVTRPDTDSGRECRWKGCTSTATVFVQGVNGANGFYVCREHRRCDYRGCGNTRVDVMPVSGGGRTLHCKEHQVCRKDCGSTDTVVYETPYGPTTLCADHAEESPAIDSEVTTA